MIEPSKTQVKVAGQNKVLLKLLVHAVQGYRTFYVKDILQHL